MNATKLRDQLDALLDKLTEQAGTEAAEEGEQATADQLYGELASTLVGLLADYGNNELTAEQRPTAEFLAGFALAIEAVTEALPPSDEAREAHPIPNLPNA